MSADRPDPEPLTPEHVIAQWALMVKRLIRETPAYIYAKETGTTRRDESMDIVDEWLRKDLVALDVDHAAFLDRVPFTHNGQHRADVCAECGAIQTSVAERAARDGLPGNPDPAHVHVGLWCDPCTEHGRLAERAARAGDGLREAAQAVVEAWDARLDELQAWAAEPDDAPPPDDSGHQRVVAAEQALRAALARDPEGDES